MNNKDDNAKELAASIVDALRNTEIGTVIVMANKVSGDISIIVVQLTTGEAGSVLRAAAEISDEQAVKHNNSH